MIIYISLTRRELEVINRQNLKYPLAIAEKDYLLKIGHRGYWKAGLVNLV